MVEKGEFKNSSLPTKAKKSVNNSPKCLPLCLLYQRPFATPSAAPHCSASILRGARLETAKQTLQSKRELVQAKSTTLQRGRIFWRMRNPVTENQTFWKEIINKKGSVEILGT